jgi:hypothetical protein
MTLQLEKIIDAAAELSPIEQIELITAVSQFLQRGYSQGAVSDFWQSKTLTQVIEAQQIHPIKDIADLAGDFWPEDESADSFVSFLEQQRVEDRMRD